MKTNFPNRRRRSDEVRMDKMVSKAENGNGDDKKEIKRENKQVKRLARLRGMEAKGKTKSNKYKKLKQKVYNPFEKKLSRRKAIKEFKQSYDRVGKVKSGEYDREKREFYYDGRNIRLMPTDDADNPITRGIKKRNQGQNFK